MSMTSRSTALLLGLLIIVALAGGFIYAVAATPSASADVKTIFVGPELKDCEGMGPMRCLQIADSADGPWMNWYGEIEGFIHQPGMLSELQVREIELRNPPADGSSLRLVLVAIVAQSSTGLAEGALDGSSWNLVSIDGTPVVAGSPASLGFSGAQVSGSAGCNSFFGGYTVAGNGLSLSQLGSTKMACSPELNAQENAFLAALAEAESYTIDGDTLTISFDGGKQIIFSAA